MNPGVLRGACAGTAGCGDGAQLIQADISGSVIRGVLLLQAITLGLSYVDQGITRRPTRIWLKVVLTLPCYNYHYKYIWQGASL